MHCQLAIKVFCSLLSSLPRVVRNASDASLVFPWAMWAALCSWAAWINSIFDPLNLSCKCVKVTSTFIRPVKYAKVEIFPGGVACRKMEIIIADIAPSFPWLIF
uniref:Chemokine interleukin-8-like domain-containing protein n=1 Tax=Pseudonaja textilis TaxID=8673 RepID=A0A670ZUU6_PSETE